MSERTLKLDEGREVGLLLPQNDGPGKPLLILAHGAGNAMDAPFLETTARHLEENGVSVLRFNFPYKQAGRKAPNSTKILMEAWKAVADWAAENLKYSALFLGGKSMGGRIATMIANDVSDLQGLIFFGYPLHPPGKFDRIRDDYLYTMRQQMLFIQGTRDPFARMDLLTQTLTRLRDRHKLHWVEGGNHSFKVLVRQGVSYPEVLSKISEVAAKWIHDIATKST
ncbi:MAG: alpha/beta hydrolase family protein [Calditrichia bacterium]